MAVGILDSLAILVDGIAKKCWSLDVVQFRGCFELVLDKDLQIARKLRGVGSKPNLVTLEVIEVLYIEWLLREWRFHGSNRRQTIL